MLLEELEQTQLELFKDNLPYRPYCTDNKDYGLQIRPKSIAIGKKIIQPNTVAKIMWLVFDYDEKDILGRIEATNSPYPNLIVINPENGKSHIFYSLKTPVCRTEKGHTWPLEYLAKIQYALREKIGSDVGYSGLVSKNPLSPYWKVMELVQRSYDLKDLAEYVELPIDLPQRALTEGLGRNCSIFEVVRKIAYKNVIKFKVEADQDKFKKFVLEQCQVVNNEFPEPLHFQELNGISKSISKWVWNKYTKRWTDQKFSEIQAKRGRKGGINSGTARTIKNEEKRLVARSMRSEGHTLKEISAELEVPLSTVGRWCSSNSHEAISDNSTFVPGCH